MTRKSMMSSEIVSEIISSLSIGLTKETAARSGKISYQTFYNWYNRGKRERERIESGEKAKRSYVREEKIYLDFFNQVEAAEIKAITGWQGTVNTAARIDPAYAMKMLQLRDPRGYRSTEVTATLDLSKATNEQLERIASGEDPITVMASSSPGNFGAS